MSINKLELSGAIEQHDFDTEVSVFDTGLKVSHPLRAL